MPDFYTKEYILQRLEQIEQEKKYLERHLFSLYGPHDKKNTSQNS